MSVSTLATTYEASPTKRGRRTKAEIEAICEAMYRIALEDHPLTVRHMFYRLVGEGLIAKTEQEYKGTICRLLTRMRRERRLPFAWISDNTRWITKPASYSGLTAALRRSAETYRRSVWDNQPVRVEIWSEKDAIGGILVDVTSPWDVPLMVVQGYSSLTYLHSAAEMTVEADRPTYIYHFGDHDPSGLDIERFIRHELETFAPDAELYFQRVAVTPHQIQEWGLPTRPTKQSDSRSKGFEGESVDVDTITPSRLRELTERCITRHIDSRVLAQIKVVEDQERATLHNIAEQVSGWGRAS
jgi:hypothetical protein